MKYQRRRILSYLAKTPILILYISFFIVQLFFNFDIANTSKNTTLFSCNKIVATGRHSFVIKKTNTAKDQKQALRLNKRFKPQVILAYTPFDIKSPVYYLGEKPFGFYASVFIPASFLFPQFFRGPPVVA